MSAIIIKEKITETLKTNFMPYAMSVIVSRAIPSIDGLKPSHRKLLYTMFKMGLINGNRTKSANVVGTTMKLNPHGDQAIYETLVRMTRGNQALLKPFIDSKGNFGKQYSRDMRYAASRYTEVKLMPICKEMFRDIDKNAVEFEDNYDGTIQEPVMLPSAYPNVLVNSSQGIAVGMASNLASFNITEVCEATIAYIKDKDINIMEYLKAPDFSTGGELLFDEEAIRTIYETGRGIIKIRGKYNVDSKKRHIEIYEIPYTTSAEAIIDGVIDLVKANKLKEVTDVRDETDKKGLKITLDIRKGTDVDRLMIKLFAKTSLEDSFGCNFNLLINGRPMVLGIKSILSNWIDFRIQCVKRTLNYELVKNKEKLHLLLGLDRILLDIDKAIQIIRNTEKEVEVIPNLMESFRIDEIQANYVAEIKLKYLNREYLMNRLDEIKELQNKIDHLNKTLGDVRLIKRIIVTQLESIIKNYGEQRHTNIVNINSIETLSDYIDIDDYNLKVFMTKENYFKKIPLTALRTTPEQKIKNTDSIVREIESTNRAEAIFFSDKANAYKMKLHQIPDCKAGDFGEYLPNLLGMLKDEKIIYFVITKDFKGTMMYGFENGKIAKVPLSSYETKQNRKLLSKAYYPGSKIKHIELLAKEKEMVVITSKHKALIFNTEKISVKATRSTQGITIIKTKADEVVNTYANIKESKLKDINLYRAPNIPAVGKNLSVRDKKRKQISIFDL